MSKETRQHSLEFDFVVCGVGIQNPYTGETLSVEKKEIEYREKPLKNCLHIRYCIFVSRDSSVSNQEYVNTVIVKERDLFLQTYTLLLGRPSQILVHQARLDREVVEPKFPPQKIPSGLYNLISLWNRPNTNYYYTSLVYDDGWPILETLLKTFRSRPAIMQDNKIALPLRWFSKGANETNSLDRLVAFWICFNALYENQDELEWKAIENCVDDNLDQIIAERFVSQNSPRLTTLSKFPIELGRKNKRQIAQELRDLLNASPQDSLLITRAAILTIYGVRNSLFHGDCNPESVEDRRMIELSERLLSKLMQEFIAKQILEHPLPHNKFVIQEKLGF